ncbi:MAG: transketolase [Spirochaetales bacterium]|nr:transketolase [Spirochaetales bacterium]
MKDIQFLQEAARKVRIDCLKIIHAAKSGHPGGSLSAADILTVLYYYKLRIDPKNPKWPDRDRFILSKGHAAPALFVLLAHRGFYPLEELKGFRKTGGMLQGAVGITVPGADMSTGSLGQYLSVGAGMAIAGRMDNKDYKVYVLLGDGELQEGQVWEAAMTAVHHKLGNLVAILDFNKVQMCGTLEEIMDLGDPEAKFKAFGWNVVRIDGHDMKQIIEALDGIPNQPHGTPTMIIADTIKGKGVSFMEGKAQWHGGAPTDEQLAQALKELGGEE